MSAPKRPIILAPRARRDLSDIELYTAQQWGSQQRRAYMAKLERALQQLAEFPELGRLRSDLAPGLRSHPVGDHIIYYRAKSASIMIVRVVHRRMDSGMVRDQ